MSYNFKRRLDGLQKKMDEADLDLVVYGSCQNFQYLTGLLIDWNHGINLGSPVNNVFVPKKGAPILTLDGRTSSDLKTTSWIKDIRVLDVPYGAKATNYQPLMKKVVSDLDFKSPHARLGLGDHVWGSTAVALMKTLRNAQFLEAEALMDDVRKIKDEGEIKQIKKACELTDKVLEAVIPKVREGATQRELGLELESEGRRRGASDISFTNKALFVKSGSEVSTNPFTYPKDKGLVPGTSIAFDFGFVVDGYVTDFGRSFYLGPASMEAKNGYEALQQSVVETLDEMKDGAMKCCEAFPTIEKKLDKRGYGQYLRARLPDRILGHNIGIEVHEPPWLSPQYDEVLRSGMVMAVEPKLWHAGEYYFRNEDVVLVGAKKAESLTKFDRELFQL